MKVENRIKGSKNTRRGEQTEKAAALWLKRAGFLEVEKIETPWRVIRRGGRIVGATPKKQVSGDFTAIHPESGQYVHVEVKSRDRDRLHWSDFEKHQIDALDRKAKAGALGVILWVRSPVEIKWWVWPVEGFGPGKSLKWEEG